MKATKRANVKVEMGKELETDWKIFFQELVKKLPSTPINWNRGRLEAGPSKHGHY